MRRTRARCASVRESIDWYDPGRVPDDAVAKLHAHFRARRPVGVVGQGELQRSFYARLTITSAAVFDGEAEGVEPWGVLESAEYGAVLVPAELAAATTLPELPPALHRLASRVGPVTRRLEQAKRATDERPAVQRFRERFIAAAVAHAELHRRLEEWQPRPERERAAG
ncbi:hypothetical protein [Agromyces sp. NPDC060279]|uniref:hypothetical protein n=1 Tax=Agromyces sp. NPDC060279 TaxID=3347092 RepID=UPI00366604DD